jgi:hypothetical protein
MSVFDKTIKVTFKNGKNTTYHGQLGLWPGTYLIKRWFIFTIAAIPFSAVEQIDIIEPRQLREKDIKRTGY